MREDTVTNISVFGLGEAGSLFSADLVKAGARVRAYDPAGVTTPEGVERFDNPHQAVADAHVVISLTAAADAAVALEQAIESIPDNAIYADFSTASAGLKIELAERAAQQKLDFADIALLGVVPGNGIRTPGLASGTGADDFAKIFQSFGSPLSSISGNAGDAATRKLLRSVFMKGLAATLIEAMKAAEKAGLSAWLWDNVSMEIAAADELLLRRLVSGTAVHVRRRHHEMQTAVTLLNELGVEPLMTKATLQNLEEVMANGLPEIPRSNSSKGLSDE